jgi:hypothetical protein
LREKNSGWGRRFSTLLRRDGSGESSTSDNLGYFGYNSNFESYIEVISFERLLNSARERNRAFFDKLGLPTQ